MVRDEVNFFQEYWENKLVDEICTNEQRRGQRFDYADSYTERQIANEGVLQEDSFPLPLPQVALLQMSGRGFAWA